MYGAFAILNNLLKFNVSIHLSPQNVSKMEEYAIVLI